MEITTTAHSLRTITLRYDCARTAPEFEREALQYYQEIHDLAWEIKQRIQAARKQVPSFKIPIEELAFLLQEAKGKFDHLKTAYDRNPYKGTIRVQLKKLLVDINKLVDDFVPRLIDLTAEYFEYDEYIFAKEQWMNDIAFPQFSKIIKRYEERSVDMVFFDQDLDDFKGALGFVKKQERKYIHEMNEVVDDYTGLNEEIDAFFEEIKIFDEALITFG